MKVQLMIGAIAVTASVAALGAQSGSAAASGSQEHGTAASVRITGCVERADQVMPLAGAALGTTVDSQEFVLIHAQTAGSEPLAAAAPTGTAGSSPSAARPGDVGAMFRLDAKAALLNQHVGHRVEVTGTRDGAAAASDARADAANPSAASAPLFRVSSIKMVAETCGR